MSACGRSLPGLRLKSGGQWRQRSRMGTLLTGRGGRDSAHRQLAEPLAAFTVAGPKFEEPAAGNQVVLDASSGAHALALAQQGVWSTCPPNLGPGLSTPVPTAVYSACPPDVPEAGGKAQACDGSSLASACRSREPPPASAVHTPLPQDQHHLGRCGGSGGSGSASLSARSPRPRHYPATGVAWPADAQRTVG